LSIWLAVRDAQGFSALRLAAAQATAGGPTRRTRWGKFQAEEPLIMRGKDRSRRPTLADAPLAEEEIPSINPEPESESLPDESAIDRGAVRNSAVRFLARQPILDCNGRVYGYELLFRNGPLNAFSGDHEYASRTMADNTILFGLEELTGGHQAFFNCTEDFLLSDLPYLLPAESTVLEILETVEPSKQLIEACETLRARGYRFALDDFIWQPQFAQLVKLADFIKIDFLALNQEERKQLHAALPRHRATMLAEKIETEAERRQARREGYTLFQGYYFCRPQMMEMRTIPSNTRHHFELLQLLMKDPLDLDKLCPLVEGDVSLAYRVLRLVNSAAYYIPREVRSIRTALVLLGDDIFRRLATLAITSELGISSSPEIVRMALVRARFCELAARLMGLAADEQYLLGMASLFPAMLRIPAETIAASLPLRKEIREALCGADHRERRLLAVAELLEQGNWETCDKLLEADDLSSARILEDYEKAIRWSATVLPSARRGPAMQKRAAYG
jgi:c-di-GMP-related signal transduction protein